MGYVPISLGNAGVLAPRRWRWAAAIGWMILLVLAQGLISAAPFALRKMLVLSPEAAGAAAAAALALGYAAYTLLVRFGEKRPVEELRPAALVPDVGLGLLIGAGMFALVFASLRLLGVYTLAPSVWSDWPTDLLRFTGVGFGEELITRAIIFRLLMRAAGMWPAIILSSILFGAGHLGNPNATWLGAVAIAVEAGTMLAGFYLLTGRLWMSVGVHIAWNVMQGPVFGARVSGNPEVGSLFVSGPVAGTPEWLSGGIFGPEASVSAMIVGLAVFVVTWAGARRRGFV
jgi:membrane protease YdiL (CAAX protease family)